MREQIKNEIEELKEVTLDLFRSASILDEYVRLLEVELENPEYNDEYTAMHVRQIMQYRMDLKARRGYDKLEEKENRIWQQLIDAVKGQETH